MVESKKRVPESVLIFGAAAHIGGPLAAYLHQQAPRTRLRLATSTPANADVLRRNFPSAEVVNASYFDLASLQPAVDGIEGVFVLTRSGTDEGPAMTNLVTALKSAGSAVHVVRLVGMLPESNPRLLPPFIRDHRLGLPVQHPIAKSILDESELPVTYLNIFATFMDNFFWMKEGLCKERKLIWPERLIPFIDPREIAEVAGRLLLSDNHRHVGQFYTLNNGHDLMLFSEVAELMTQAWNEPIVHDGRKESFFAAYAMMGRERVQFLWDFFQYERSIDVVWSRNDMFERLLGRKPRSLRAWLEEHRAALLS